MQFLIMGVAFLGIVLSGYALYLEERQKRIMERLGCDANTMINCGDVLGSKYGKLFGVPLPIFGITFYLTMLLLAWLDLAKIVFGASIIAVLSSIVLAYVSYAKLKKICLVCTSLYVVSILLFLVSWYPLRA